MLRKHSPVFDRLMDRIAAMPVIDCHEHLGEPDPERHRRSVEVYADPVRFLTGVYLVSDMWSSGASAREIELLQSPGATTDVKWPIFQRLWTSSEHTAYAQVTRMMLKDVFGVDALTRDSMERVAEELAVHDHVYHCKLLHDAGIRALVTDVLCTMKGETRQYQTPELRAFLGGRFQPPDSWRQALHITPFHELRRRELVEALAGLVDRNITSMEEYEEALFELLERGKERGVIALKDQSAYLRGMSFDLPARDDAERLFNRLLDDPRSQLAWPDVKPMDDYLFHQFMRFARDLDLPVQIHTGHMAGIRNRVDKANAAHMASVLELHTQVRFDLLHGNWPYMGDTLFLAKNYPNVTLNLCWLPIIDPLYYVDLLKRAVVTVPHGKIHAFGGDYDWAELTPAHLLLAREGIAAALADLVECGWIEEEQAVRIAAGWLFNNPNAYYRLGLEPYSA